MGFVSHISQLPLTMHLCAANRRANLFSSLFIFSAILLPHLPDSTSAHHFVPLALGG